MRPLTTWFAIVRRSVESHARVECDCPGAGRKDRIEFQLRNFQGVAQPANIRDETDKADTIYGRLTSMSFEQRRGLEFPQHFVDFSIIDRQEPQADVLEQFNADA